jgi:eukaryotic-like serine/threonine-protein kinase
MPQAQQLGRYQLLDRLAFGGMAEIFRAKTFDSQGNQHLVAVKKVLNHLITDEEFIKMLVDEAKVCAQLRHDNIARVYEFAHADDEYFLAMEYVDGKDVRTLLERHRVKKKPIPPEHVAWIIAEVATALHCAHTQRDAQDRPLEIVHRDVSPSNVLCSYNGEVKLCDFGIAKATLTRVQTKTGVIKGKVKYMSPEQAMGRKLDGRSDLFSLGSVMYEMLTLMAPFTAPTEVELIFAVRDAQKRDVIELVRDIPIELSQILNKLMSRSRSQRYQTGEALADELRLFLEGYKPGYKRSHFGRFMRKVFEEDIERELRILEEYVIDDSADPSEVGENLIADALEDDAPYTQFTANATAEPSTRIGSKSSRIKKRGDLHAEPTRIFDPDHPRAMRELPTRILDSRRDRGFDEVTTGQRSRGTGRTPATPLPTPSTPLSAPPSSTGDRSRRSATAAGELQALPTRVFDRGSPASPKIHDAKTQIIQRPTGERRRRDTTPAPPPAMPRVTARKTPSDDFDENEETSLPLSDDDLEPV